jgi:hypothetical protein
MANYFCEAEQTLFASFSGKRRKPQAMQFPKLELVHESPCIGRDGAAPGRLGGKVK